MTKTELTDKQKLDLLVDLATTSKKMLTELMDENNRSSSPIQNGNAIGIDTAIKAFSNAFLLIGKSI